jgi:hypothetical protein
MWCVGGGILQLVPESFEYMKQQGNILFAYGGIPAIQSPLYEIFEWPMRCLQNNHDGFLFWNTTGIGDNFLVSPAGSGTVTLYYTGVPFGRDEVYPSIRLKFQRNAVQVADLVKMYEGTYTFDKMRTAIDGLYGITRDKWYSWLPDHLKAPAHTITNADIGRAFLNKPSTNATPELPRQVKEKVLELADLFKGAESIWR